MNKFTTYLLALSVASASLASCSSTHYAFNAHAPAYLGAQPVATAPVTAAAAPDEALPAASAATVATGVTAPAAHRGAARPHRAARPAAAARHQKVVSAALTAAPVAAEHALTKTARQAFKHELKRQLGAAPKSTSAEGKSQLVAALLCFFLGGLGIHDFYLGYIGKGILQIFLSLILIGIILVIIDFIRILTGRLKPKGGEYAKTI